jgi:hypothetical protein
VAQIHRPSHIVGPKTLRPSGQRLGRPTQPNAQQKTEPIRGAAINFPLVSLIFTIRGDSQERPRRHSPSANATEKEGTGSGS